MKVSIFKNFNKVEENADLQVILGQISKGKYKDKILELRKLVKENKMAEYNDKKRSLPAFTPSGLFEGGRKLEFLKEYTGCLVLDIDKLTREQLLDARVKVASIPYTYCCFISPGGQGLKILVKVVSRPVFHRQVFKEITDYYEKVVELPVDPSGKDITRLCFVSWDADLFLNPSSVVYKTHVYLVEEDIEHIVREIEKRGIDLTDGYINWVKTGFALTDALGEEGREYFHRISRFYSGYDRKECDDQFDRCLVSKGAGVTISTLFYFARDHGIDITGLRSQAEPDRRKAKAEPVKARTSVEPKEEMKGPKKIKNNQIEIIEAYLSSHYELRYNTVTARIEIRRKTEPAEPEPGNGEEGREVLHEASFKALTDYKENSLLRELLKNNIRCSIALLRSILYSDYSIYSIHSGNISTGCRNGMARQTISRCWQRPLPPLHKTSGKTVLRSG